MLRQYELNYSEIHKVQSFVNHVMLDVVLNAKNISNANFSSSLVLPKYKSLIDDTNNKYIYTPLNKIFKICKTLNRNQLKLLKTAVHNNNKIRELCNGVIQPVKYEKIEAVNPKLSNAIRTFCDSLYEHCIGLAPFYRKYENINGYYKKIVKKSKQCKCCGTGPVLTQFHTHRGALDHYLPKSIYPFNSVNFKNLIPICEYCNEKYKLSIDTLCKTIKKGKRIISKNDVKAFYPFSKTKHEIEISIKLENVISIKSLEPENINITLSCNGYDEQVETWERVFGIKENYKAECCTEEMLNYFEEQYMALIYNGISHENYIEILNNNKYVDTNFLKIPFLEAINA